MAALHIENVPESLLKDLAAQAARSGRSVAEEALRVLQRELRQAARDRAWVEETLRDARALRESMPNACITEEEIRAARDEGRE